MKFDGTDRPSDPSTKQLVIGTFTADGMIVFQLLGCVPGALDLAYSHATKRFACASAISMSIMLLDADSFQPVGAPMSWGEGRKLMHHKFPIALHSLSFSKSGRFLIATCADAVHRVWDLDSGTFRDTEAPEEFFPTEAFVTADDKFLFSAESMKVSIWSLETGELLRRIVIPLADGFVMSMAWDEQRNVLIGVTKLGEVRAWGLRECDDFRAAVSMRGAVMYLEVLSDRRQIVCVTKNGLCSFFSLNDFSLVHSFRFERGEPTELRYHPHSDTIVVHQFGHKLLDPPRINLIRLDASEMVPMGTSAH